MPEPMIFDEDYNGPRWKYAMTHRPPMIACQPDGRIIGADRRPDPVYPSYPFGTIQYPRKLTAQEIASFELEELEYDSGLMILDTDEGLVEYDPETMLMDTNERERPALQVRLGMEAEWIEYPPGRPLLRLGLPNAIEGYRLTTDQAKRLAEWILANTPDSEEDEDAAHERAHEAGSWTLVPREECPQCQFEASQQP